MTYYRGQRPNIQPQGFYNPWMPGPDIGRGVRGFVEQMQQKQRYQQQLGQQQWQRGITEQEMGQRERGIGLREEELGFRRTQEEATAEYRRQQLKKEPKEIVLAKALVDSGYADDMGKAMAFVMKLQKPEEVLDLLEKELQLEEKYRPEKAPDIWDKRMALGRKLVDQGLLDEGTFGMTMFGVQLQPSLTPASITSNRRQIFDKVDNAIRSVTAGREGDPQDTVLDPQVVEDFASREGIYLWAPNKYSQILQAKALNPNLVTEEELKYVEQVKRTKEYFDTNLKDKGIPLEGFIASKTVAELEALDLDYETLTMLYRIYPPPKEPSGLSKFMKKIF